MAKREWYTVYYILYKVKVGSQREKYAKMTEKLTVY
jgi:hypothetical protein